MNLGSKVKDTLLLSIDSNEKGEFVMKRGVRRGFSGVMAAIIALVSILGHMYYAEPHHVHGAESMAETHTHVDGDIQPGVYYIKNANSGMYLQVKDSSTSSGKAMQQGSFTGKDNQMFKFVADGKGNFFIMTAVTDYAKCIDVDDDSSSNNKQILQSTYTGADVQKFQIVKQSDGTFAILTETSDYKSGVQVKDASKSADANVVQYTYSGATEQKWIIESALESAEITEGEYFIKNVHSGLYMDVEDDLATFGADIQQWKFDGSVGQIFKIVEVQDGWYTFYTKASNYVHCMDVLNGSTDNGADVRQYEYFGGNMQLFKVVPHSDGSYSFLSQVSNGLQAVEVFNGGKNSGNNVSQWGFWGGTPQKWVLEPYSGDSGNQTVSGGKYEHIFKRDGLTSSFYTFSSCNLGDKDSYKYDGTTYSGNDNCLKLESSTSIKFTAANSGTLTLYFGDASAKGDKVNIDGDGYSLDSDKKITVNLDAGTHTIKQKETQVFLYVMVFEETHVHSYSSSATKAPTCTADGIRTYICSCGHSYTETVQERGHEYENEYTVDVAATASTAGSMSRHCKNCSATTDVTVIPATGSGSGSTGGAGSTVVSKYEHIFEEHGISSDFFSITGNLSTSKGKGVYDGNTYSTCLKLESSTKISFTAETAGTLKLYFGGNTDAAGVTILVDGKEQTVDASEVVTVDLEAGEHTVKQDETQIFMYAMVFIPEGSVDSGDSSGGSGSGGVTYTHRFKELDGKEVTQYYSHGTTSAFFTTLNFDGDKLSDGDKFKYDGKTDDGSDNCMKMNSSGKVQFTPETAGTFTLYFGTSYAGDTIKISVGGSSSTPTIDAEGKVSVEVGAGKKVIVTKGSAETKLYVMTYSTGPVHEHVYVDEITKEPTCTEDGVTTYTCSCGDSYEEPITKLGHNYDSEFTVDVEPTTSSTGSKSRHCLNDGCDSKTDVTTLSKISIGGTKYEHIFERDKVSSDFYSFNTTALTTKKGSVSYEGKTYKTALKLQSATKVKFTSDVKGTLTLGFCSACTAKEITIDGEIYTIGDFANNVVIVELEPGEHVIKKEEGESFLYYMVFQTKVIVEEGDVHVHSFTSTITTPATCSEAGIKTYTCACGKDSYTVEIAPLGHMYELVSEKDATCTVAGERVFTCLNGCGDSYSTAIPALGHNYTSQVTKAATCVATGVMTYTCSNCGGSYTETIPMTGHDYNTEFTIDKAATTTETGSMSRHCKNCDAKTDVITIPVVQNPVSKYVHIFEKNGTTSDFYSITGNTATDKGTVTYESTSYKTCLKMESSTSIVFTATYDGEVNLYFDSGSSGKRINLNGTSRSIDSDVIENFSVTAGTKYTITKESSDVYLFVIEYIPDGATSSHTHSYQSIITKESTCTTQGVITYVCSCGDFSTEPAPLSDHDYESEYTIDVPATSTTEGSKSRHCKNCEAKTDVTVIPVITIDNMEDKVLFENGVPNQSYGLSGVDLTWLLSLPDEAIITLQYTTTSDIYPGTIVMNWGATVDNQWAIGNMYSAGNPSDSIVTVNLTLGELKETLGITDSSEVEVLCITTYNNGTIVRLTVSSDGNYGSSSTPEEDHEHEYTWVITSQATCTTNGVKTYTCECGDVQEVAIPATGHTYGAGQVTKEPTCSVAGVKTYYCTVCGGGAKTESIPVVAHTPGQTVKEKVTAVTCTGNGYYENVVYCSVCGEELSRTPVTVNATGHTPQAAVKENVTDSTCTASGSYHSVVYCSVCNAQISRETVQTDPLGHNYKDVVTEPTCTVGGYTTHTCQRCSHSYVDTQTAAKGHTGKAAVKENVVNENCGVAGSYDSVVYCSVCDAEVSRNKVTVDPTGNHTHAAPVVENNKGATCTEAGSYDSVVYCTVCKKEVSRETVNISALGHDEMVATTNPTCTQDGLKVTTCSRCDYRKEETIKALGHNYTSQITAPTCTEQGYTTHTCSVCGDNYKDNYIAANGHTNGAVIVENNHASTCETDGSYDNVIYCTVCDAEVSRQTVIVGATGHKYTQVISDRAATCEVAGEKKTQCEVCGDIKTETSQALGHNYTAVVTQPTCTEQGYTTYTCQRDANHTYKDNYTDAKGHTNAAAVEENRQEPTCGEAGSYESVVYCSVCSAQQSRQTVTIPATGNHTPGTPVEENRQEATCTATGSYENVTNCTVCEQEISRETVTIPKKNHVYGAWTEVTAATCTAEGLEERTCTTCDTSTETRAIVKLPHSYIDTVTPPTCTEDGYTTHTCSACGDSYKDSATDATGHNAGSIVVENNVPATCGAAGSYDNVTYCTKCHVQLSRQTINVPATGAHTEGAEPVKDAESEILPTCTASGSYDNVYYCTVCHLEVRRAKITVAATGHSYGAWNETKAATCTATGMKEHTCTVNGCGHVEEEVIPELGHNYQTAVTDPTCTEKGYTTHTCSRCSDSYVDTYVNALGHTENAPELTGSKDATCGVAGYKDYRVTCSVCHNEVRTYREDIAATGLHTEATRQDNVVEADCTHGGSYDHVVYCTECLKVISTTPMTTQAKGHTWDSGTKDPDATCTTAGTMKYQCTVDGCDGTKEETIPAKGHTPGTPVVTRVEATYENPGSITTTTSCTVCQAVISEQVEVIPPNSETCTHDFREVDGTRVEPTCTEDGRVTMKCNSTCGYSYDKTLYATGHSWGEEQVVEHVDPNCTQPGYTIKAQYCTNGTCGAETNRTTTELLATGHASQPAVEENRKEYCTEQGSYDMVVYCSNANCPNANKEVSRTKYVVDPIGHTWNSGEVTTPATCETDGVMTYTCTHTCGDGVKCTATYTDVIGALGHEWNAGEQTEAPDCVNAGEMKYTCTRGCIRTEDIPATGHDEQEAVKEVHSTATCYREGSYDMVVYCANANCPNANKEVSRTAYTESKTAHTEAAAVTENEIAATCISKGSYDKVVYCSVCEANGYVTELNRSTYSTPMTAHTYSAVGEVTTNPTCTDKGVMTYRCTGANCQATRTEDIAALGHDWDEGTITTPMTCETAGVKTYNCKRDNCIATKTETIVATGHAPQGAVEINQVTATCYREGGYDTVIRCGNAHCNKADNILSSEHTTLAKLAHTPAEAVQENVVAADCTHAGSYNLVVRCQVADCKEVISTTPKTIAALGHSWEAEGEVTVEPNCKTDGEMTYECTYVHTDGTPCNEVKTEVIPALKHDYREVGRTDATCTVNGTIYYECARVGCDGTTDRTKTETIVATGHVALPEAKENDIAATCTVAGGYDMVVRCDKCNDILSSSHTTIAAIGHSYDAGVVTTSPKCEIPGVKTYTCAHDAQHTYTEEVPALKHNYVEVSRTPAKCTVAGAINSECTICHGTKSDSIPAIGHKMENPVTENSVTATCYREGGYDTVVYCENCDEELSRQHTKIAMGSHTPAQAVRENEVAPTCETVGSYEEVVYCSVCKAASVDTELSRTKHTIDETGHRYDTGLVTTNPTCDTKGVKTYTCLNSNCNHSYTEDVAALGHTPGVAVTENNQEATCQAAGHYDKVVYCTVCHDELSRVTTNLDKLSHTPGTAVTENNQAATCTADGSYEKAVYCTGCGTELSRKTYTVDALGHTNGTPVVENRVEAAYNAAGSYETVIYCTVCHDEVSRVKTIIPKLVCSEHIYGTGTVTTHPTCEDEGVRTYTCERDGCTHSYTEVIPAKGHTAGAAQKENVIEPTCLKVGSYYKVVYCTDCGEELERTHMIVSKLSHKATPGATKDCHSKCSVCGEVISSKHNYTSKVTKEATCAVAGERTYTCECGYTFKEIIGSKEHTEIKGGTADCHSSCSVCGSVVSSKHRYTSKVLKEATYTETGLMQYSCDCGYVYTEDIPKLIPDFLYGDVNRDKKVDVMDAVELKKYLAGSKNDIDLLAADVDVDGKVGTLDAVKLMKYLAGTSGEILGQP